jgi:hypothetical protein
VAPPIVTISLIASHPSEALRTASKAPELSASPRTWIEACRPQVISV